MKILTEEQREQILQQMAEEIVKSPRWESPATTFTSKEIDRIRDDALLEAQARFTLKEVGEWLEKWGCHFREDEILTGEPAGRIGYLSDEVIEALKRGEMPE